MSDARWVGRPERRREDARFLRGEAKYLDDLERAGQLHAAFARSPFPHARIAGIDTGEALASPGVIAVLTGAELEDVGPLPPGSIEDGVVADAGHPVLARGTTRYVGEPLALVVAETRAQAEDAAELVLPELDPLAPVLDAREAAESGA
ncbi:MAG: xanthine dehydrogenase family protein molybdopterin-binding subunit, partial [Actinomycetota bacterium]|nr:xanthine dehydrogenase family protein molybdopterin-binding subunit [Actinomycetota bacterium]